MLSKEQQFDILSRMTAAHNLTDLLDVLGAEIEALCITEAYLINLLDAEGRHVVSCKVHYMAEFKSLEQTHLGTKSLLNDAYVNARAFNTRSIARVDRSNASGPEIAILQYWKACEIVGVPIIDTRNDSSPPIGTVILLKQVEPIPQQRLALFQELLTQFYNCLTTLLRFSQLEEMHDQAAAAVEENRRLLQFLDEMSSLTSVAKIYTVFATELFRQLSFEAAGFTLLENQVLSASHVEVAHPDLRELGDAWQKFMMDNPFPVTPTQSGASYVFFRDEAMVFPDVQDIMHLQMAEHDLKILAILKTARTLFITPIRYQKKPIGVCAFYSLSKPLTLTESDFHLLEQLSSFLGTALNNSKIYSTIQEKNLEIGYLNKKLQEKVEKLAEQASTDQLTGLFNFRTFEQELAQRVYEAQRSPDKNALSMLLIDIDYFKNFNDTHGHAAGNDVLAGVSKEIAKLIRQNDMACRYGGEEFSVILPQCDFAGAMLLAERIRHTIEARAFPTCAGVRNVTVSIGCTMLQASDTLQTFFARVDGALYQAKHGGRNQICRA